MTYGFKIMPISSTDQINCVYMHMTQMHMSLEFELLLQIFWEVVARGEQT